MSGVLFPLSTHRGCDVCRLRGQAIVPITVGRNDPKIMLVGEGPGETEVDKGLPFVGRSGKFLDRVLRHVGLSRDDVILVNAAQCRTVDRSGGNAPPDAGTLRACSIHWERHIEKFDPAVIVALGVRAFNSLAYLTGRSQYRMSQVRRSRWTCRGRHMVPTYHPAHCLRDPDREPFFIADIRTAIDLASAPPPYFGEVVTADDPATVEALLREVVRAGATAWDVEGGGAHPICSIAFTLTPNTAVAIPLIHDDPRNRNYDGATVDPRVLHAVKSVLENPAVYKYGQNFHGYDVPEIQRAFGIRTVIGRSDDDLPTGWDTMYGSYVEEERSGYHSLDLVAARYGYYGGYDWRMNRRLMLDGLDKSDIGKLPWRTISEYGGRDVIATHVAAQTQQREFPQSYNRMTLFLTSCSRHTTQYREHGVGFDLPAATALVDEWSTELAQKIASVRDAAADVSLNPGSDKQVSELLYGRLRLQNDAGWESDAPEHRVYRTPSGKSWSTSAGTLRTLQQAVPGNDLLKRILDYRDLQHSISTVAGLVRDVDADGRLRFSTKLHGTRTGRVTFRLHSVKHDETECNGLLVDRIWSLFVARPGHLLVKSDYSQIELRMMAEISQDPELLGIYARGEDFHTDTHKFLFADAYDPRSDKQRRIAKNANFGTPYGFDAEGLYGFLAGRIDGFDIPYSKIEKFHRDFFARFHILKAWQDQTVEDCKRYGFVVFWSGRTRWIDWTQPGKRPQNQSVNSGIQGSAHDVLLCAADEIYDTCPQALGVYPVMEHHDALIYEVPEGDDRVRAAVDFVESVMTAPPTERWFGRTVGVPLVVDSKVGPNLGSQRSL